MSFLENIGFVETAEQERARLAQAPAGSSNSLLSEMPVRIPDWPKDKLVELPDASRTGVRIVVVPFKFSSDDETTRERLPHRRHAGWWDCIIVASDDPHYPAGGYRITVPGAEIARGRIVEVAQ